MKKIFFIFATAVIILSLYVTQSAWAPTLPPYETVLTQPPKQSDLVIYDQIKHLSDKPGASPEMFVSGNYVYFLYNDVDGIIFMKSGDGGKTFDEPVRITDYNYAPYPQLAVVGNNIYVVWSNIGDDPKLRDIYMVRSTDGGNTFSKSINISKNKIDSSAVNLGDHKIMTVGNNVYIVWRLSDYTWSQIYFSKSTNGGTTFSEPKNISNASGPAMIPQISISGNNIYITWEVQTEDEGVIHNDPWFTKSNDGGNSFNKAIKINHSNIGAATPRPQIGSSGNSVYLTWIDDDGILFMKSNDMGNNFEKAVILNKPGNMGYPKMAVSGNDIYITWMDNAESLWNLFFTKSNDGGKTFSDAIRLTDHKEPLSPYDSFMPEIAASGKNVYVVWNIRVSPENYDVFTISSIDGGNTFSQIVNLSNNHGMSQEPKVITAGKNVYITWIDQEPQGLLFTQGESPMASVEEPPPQSEFSSEDEISDGSNFPVIPIIITAVGVGIAVAIIYVKRRK